MKKTLLITALLLLLPGLQSMAQFPYRWQIGGNMGIGLTQYNLDDDAPGMSLTLSYNRVIGDSRWRWGIEAGLINQGLVDYGFEENAPDSFVRPDYEYVGGFADYSIYSKNIFTLFARAGAAPALRTNMYVYHNENLITVLGIAGIGFDLGPWRFNYNWYMENDMTLTMMFSLGLFFGK